ncbi:MAG: hypothetical protein KGR26_16605, partial [Cyanobacteria bacterium REEB65]|nr:hypothetical protein [Cyanobacteria bacterium REEB65]
MAAIASEQAVKAELKHLGAVLASEEHDESCPAWTVTYTRRLGHTDVLLVGDGQESFEVEAIEVMGPLSKLT